MLKTPENDKFGSISKLDSIKSINPKALEISLSYEMIYIPIISKFD